MKSTSVPASRRVGRLQPLFWLRTRRSSVMLWVGVLAGTAVHVRGDDSSRLAAIIDNVRSQEALYADLEVKWQYSIRKEHLPGDSPGVIDTASVAFRSVRQKGLSYLNVDGSAESIEGSVVDPNFILGYDGKVTRSIRSDGKIANVQQRRAVDSRFFSPHTIVLEHYSLSFPLSILLQGDQAIKAHPGGRNFSSDRVEVSYVGEEEFGGVGCQKVAIEWVAPNAEKRIVNSRSLLWLAPLRNYLPLKEEGYNLVVDSPTIPVEVCTAKDLREIAPGIWLPFSVEITIYSQLAARQNRLVVDQRKSFEVESASLTPDYDISLFRDIPFPDGSLVYNVNAEGEITGSYQKGAPLDPHQPPRSTSAQWLLGMNLAFLLLIVGILLWRRRRFRLHLGHDGRILRSAR